MLTRFGSGIDARRALLLAAALLPALLWVAARNAVADTPATRELPSVGRLVPWPAAVPDADADLPAAETSSAAPSTVDRLASPAGATGVQAETSLSADQDTFVSETNGGTNYGANKLLFAGRPAEFGVAYGLIWFDLKDLPKDQAVTKAEVGLYLRDAGPAGDGDREAALHRIDWSRERDKVTCKESWDERDVNWNNKPKWRSSSEDSIELGTGRGRSAWVLTEQTQHWRLPDWNRGSNCNGGLLIRVDETGTGFRAFDASEGGNEPELKLTHVTDTLPPTGSMKPLPPYVTEPNVRLPDGSIDPNKAKIVLEWDGIDPAPSTGIDFFKLNGRANGGGWQVLAPTLRTYGGDFEGTNGKRVEFAIQPVDPAGNTVAVVQPHTVTHFDFSAPESRVEALPAYVPGPFDVKWSGVDLPNGLGQVGSGIASWTVLYNIGAGSWGLVAANLPLEQTSVRFDKVQQGLLYQFQVLATDKAGHMELQGALEAQTIIDGVPPVVYLRASDTIGKTSFEVSWTSVDPGGSGAVAHDVQFRSGNEPWKDWVLGRGESSQRFQAELNEVYHFRARALDKAGNQGAYPDQSQLSVTTITRDRLTSRIHLPMVLR